MERATNWAGNVAFTAQRFDRPSSVEELRRLVAGSDKIRVLGTGHSFNRIADTPGDLVSLEHLPASVEIGDAGTTVTVGAGASYADVAERLHTAGLALPNLGSLPHVSVAGACATATHGSGDRQGSLAAAVSALEMITANGEIVVLDRLTDAAVFPGAVVGLGSLGVVTRLTLDTIPTFDVAQYVYEDMAEQHLTDALPEIFSSADSVSVFTDWQGSTLRQVWLKRRVASGESLRPERHWLGASLADGPRHPVAGISAIHCTEQQGIVGPWHERLPHFRATFTPSSGDELQSEYLIARHHAVDAITALSSIRVDIARVLQISEIRTVAADDLWMSPSYRRDTVALHFTWINDPAAVGRVLRLIEQRLQLFDARPHWGKLFSMDAEVVRALYDRSADFEGLLADFDPTGKFRNAFVDAYFPAN